jgi:transcriptional regulator with XRE-family HTH domain
MNTNFGELMAKARRQKKMTLRQLSQLVGKVPSFWSEIETGRRLPPQNQETIKKLSSWLGIEEEALQKAAQTDRLRKNSTVMEKLYNTDPELAWGLYRVVEDTMDEVLLKKAFNDALKTLKNKG